MNWSEHVSLDEVGRYIHEQAEAAGYGVIVTYSRMVDELRDVANEYERLRQALRIMRSIDLEPVQSYDALGVYSILFELQDETALQEFVERRIGPVLGEEELLRTLLMLIECQMNVQKASERLFIHYNTLRYRIERLKDLGLELYNGEKMSEYFVAYHAHNLLQSRL